MHFVLRIFNFFFPFIKICQSFQFAMNQLNFSGSYHSKHRLLFLFRNHSPELKRKTDCLS